MVRETSTTFQALLNQINDYKVLRERSWKCLDDDYTGSWIVSASQLSLLWEPEEALPTACKQTDSVSILWDAVQPFLESLTSGITGEHVSIARVCGTIQPRDFLESELIGMPSCSVDTVSLSFDLTQVLSASTHNG